MKIIQPQLVTPCLPNLSFLLPFSIFVESLQTLKPAQDAQTPRGKSTEAVGAECPPTPAQPPTPARQVRGSRGSKTALGVFHQAHPRPGVTSPQRARSSQGSSTGTRSLRSRGAGQRAAVTPDPGAALRNHGLSCRICSLPPPAPVRTCSRRPHH